MPLCFDLETTALDASMASPYPADDRQAPQNYKKDEAIAAWREKDEIAWRSGRAKECALNPRLGRIVCVAAMVETPLSYTVYAEENEADVVRALWDHIAEQNGEIITFNGLGFDVPFLLTRSLILGVKPTVPLSTIRSWGKRYSYGPHYDLRAILGGFDSRASGTLTDWARALGIECSDTTKGSDVYAMYQAKDFDGIAAHAKSDVEITRALYDRVSTIYGELETPKWSKAA